MTDAHRELVERMLAVEIDLRLAATRHTDSTGWTDMAGCAFRLAADKIRDALEPTKDPL